MLNDLLRVQESINQIKREQAEAETRRERDKLAIAIDNGIKLLPKDIKAGELVTDGVSTFQFAYRQLYHPDLSEFYIYAFSDGIAKLGTVANRNSKHITSWNNVTRVESPDDMRLFLYERHQEREREREMRRDDYIQKSLSRLGAIHDYWSKLDNEWTRRVSDPEQASEAHQRLIALDSKHKEEWDMALANWQRDYEKEQERKRAEEKHQQEIDKRNKAYKASFEEWLTEAMKVSDRNLEILSKLQEQLDVPYQVVTIERGVRVDKSDETFVDAVTALVSGNRGLQDDDGYYHIVKNQSHYTCVTKRYIIPASCIIGISEPKTLKPSHGLACVTETPSQYFSPPCVRLDYPQYIYSLPNIRIYMNGLFEEFPPMPEDNHVSYASKIRGEVVKEFDFGDID